MDDTDKSSFKLTTQEFKQETDLILPKGVDPYEYIDSQERLNETALPPKVSYPMKLSAKKIMIMPSKYGSHSTVKHLAIIMTCT